jgi:hypothetical protein
MKRLRRFALVASIVFGGSFALAAAVVAAGGGQSPTSSSFTDFSASATIGGNKGAPPDQLAYYVLASKSRQTFGSGAPAAAEGSPFVTEVNVVQFSATVNNAGCFVIPNSDFRFGEDLGSASLHTTVTAANAVCSGKGGVPGGKGGPFAGGPPPPVGTLTLPITLNITWTGNGVVSTSRNTQSFDCAGYSTQFSDTVRSTFATASGDNSLLPGNFTTANANIGSDQSRQSTTGILPPTCSGG